MTNLSWSIEEKFCFPQALGTIQSIQSFSVKANWQRQKIKDSIQLLGIYHLKASVAFKEGESGFEGTLIEDFDLENQTAYFEYAIPLKIDLPDLPYEEIQLTIANEHAEITKAASFLVGFDVNCTTNLQAVNEESVTESAEIVSAEANERLEEAPPPASVAIQEEPLLQSVKQVNAQPQAIPKEINTASQSELHFLEVLPEHYHEMKVFDQLER